MTDCKNHWCEHYGKTNANCGKCVKQEGVKDEPELRVLLQKRVYRTMEKNKAKNKSQTQSR